MLTGIPVNFNGKKGFESEKKGFPVLILHSCCFEIHCSSSKRYTHFKSSKAIRITFERKILDLPSTNKNYIVTSRNNKYQDRPSLTPQTLGIFCSTHFV